MRLLYIEFSAMVRKSVEEIRGIRNASRADKSVESKV